MEDRKKLISRALLLVMGITFVFGQPCKNCLGECDDGTRVCSGNCTRGWDGPTCSRRNVAFNQTTTQSSNYSIGGFSFTSGLAVDGRTGHHLRNKPRTCTHTNKSSQSTFWKVTLDAQYNIYRFRIYNRNSSSCTWLCGARLNGFTLSVGNSSQNYRVCYKDNTTDPKGPGDIINKVCNVGGPVFGDTVKIMISNSSYLTLCEVQIFVCSNGTYGPDCEMRCGNCAEGPSACNITSGHCPQRTPRCMAGYSGPRCDKMCTNGTYGPDCGRKCGNCTAGSLVCNTTTGHCPQTSPICILGFSPPTCETDCKPGTYGSDCERKCGHCFEGVSACDVTVGHCPDHIPRCMSGYSGVTCDTECKNNTWGNDCLRTCGICYNTTECNAVTGECPVATGNPRCDSGYTGSYCVKECEKNTWGEDCQETCGKCYNKTECNAVTGECPVATGNIRCDSGYTGSNCVKEAQISFGSKVGPAYIGGGVAAAVVLIAIVVVVVIVTVRRRRREAHKSDDHGLQTDCRIFQPDNREPQDNIMFQDDSNDQVDESQGDVNPYLNADVVPSVVPVEEFPDYVVRRNAGKGFEEEFETFLVGLQAKHSAADKPKNKAKSRYRSLVAYDHSRVLLSVTDDHDTDYINACYINGYNEPKKYIASQGPNDVILNDFLRMIWEQKSGKIVMVTNLVEATKTKCCQYWPDEGSESFGLITVTLLDEENYADFTVRTLQLTHITRKQEYQTVKQFHFTAWPDHGAPAHATALLDFRDKVNSCQTQVSGPVVVHCSAGVGRTGTYIALDYLIAQAHDEGVVDVPACVRQLREQRVNMVQTLEQYKFLHEALAESLKLGSTSVPGVEFPRVFAELCTQNPETGMTKMAEQFQSLQRLTAPLDKTVITAARHPDNVSKNRSDRILAADTCRPYLSTPVPDGNNYINAVYLPTFKSKRGLIITQTPLPNTVLDFWRLVYDHDITVIVMIDLIERDNKDSGIYWPLEGKHFDPFVVKVKDKQECEGFSVWTYHLSHKDTKVAHPVKQFRCNVWTGDSTPTSIASLLSVIEEATNWQQKARNVPVLVHCRDGVTKSGLYCVATSVIERLKMDEEVNIIHTVKQMRANRPQIITDLNQFQFLHQVALEYLETAHTYANIV